CWGSNEGAVLDPITFGQLGDGTTTDTRTTPVDVIGSTDAIEISAGAVHTCAVQSSRVVRCWGGNTYGQLGDGTTNAPSTPIVSVADMTDAVQISTGYAFALDSPYGLDLAWTCATRTSGTASCWGNNRYGQLGDGTVSSRLTPSTVVGLTNVAEVHVNKVF